MTYKVEWKERRGGGGGGDIPINQLGLKIAYSTSRPTMYFEICDIIGPSSTGSILALNNTNRLTPFPIAKSMNLMTGGAQSFIGGATKNAAVMDVFPNALLHVSGLSQSNFTPWL